jgi:iron complex transport system substrate-binding protein
MRVVSLLASATEIVYGLGRGGDLVARSHECDWPPAVASLPRASRPGFPTGGSSQAIDLAVRERLTRALAIYEVDAEVLRSVQPDLIITQTQCAVCAVTPGDVERAVCELADRTVRVVSLEPNSLPDVWEDIRRVAEALGVAERGEELIARLARRMMLIATRAGHLPRPSVGVIEWIEPLMSAGNWMPELIELAGGRSCFGEAGKHSPFLEWSALTAADPEVILVSPCGFPLERTLAEIPRLVAREEWAALRAVRAGRVFLADGNAYFHRPGPRLVDSLEILAELLHPETFSYGHEGTGWTRLGA